jgi:hypothetical protein
MRYRVVEGSQSGHCCFDFTVVDTERPEIIGGKPYVVDGVPHYESICECLEREQADLIVNALNASALIAADK